LDGLLAYAAANVSNPLMAPFIVMLEIEVGSLIFTGKAVGWNLASVNHLGLSAFTAHSLVGALVVALVGASLGAAVTFAVGFILRHFRNTERSQALHHAIRETLKRYRGVRPADKHYVLAKLLTDPLTKQLDRLTFDFGHVTDVGCGRGQFSLLLLSLGKAKAIYGFDWDSAKVETARRAASGAGQFVTADLREPPLQPTDTLLLLDVLHYLSPDAQHRLLASAYDALRPNGHLLLRDIDKNRGVSAAFTRFCERVGTRLGMNRSEQLVFRSAREIRDELGALGFELTNDSSLTQTFLDNKLWVFQKR